MEEMRNAYETLALNPKGTKSLGRMYLKKPGRKDDQN
jgi:hypothetical protein